MFSFTLHWSGGKIEFCLRMLKNFPELEEEFDASAGYRSNPQITDQHLQNLSHREMNQLEQGKSDEEVLALRMRRAMLKRKSNMRTRYEQSTLKRLPGADPD